MPTNDTKTPAVNAAAAPAVKPDANALAALRLEQTKTANAVYAQANANAVSVPVKPLSAYKSYTAAVSAHPKARNPSIRQAAALAVAAAGNGKSVANNVKLSRKFKMRGAEYTIENGCLSDAIRAGLCEYDAKTETITIRNADQIKSLCGSKAISV